jgi:hypothetical protein
MIKTYLITREYHMEKNILFLLLLITLSLNARERFGCEKNTRLLLREIPTTITKKEDKQAQSIITNIANIFINFIGMATNPHDKESLALHGCAIINSISNIVQQSYKVNLSTFLHETRARIRQKALQK